LLQVGYLAKKVFEIFLAKNEKACLPLQPASTGSGYLEKVETKNLKIFRSEFGKSEKLLTFALPITNRACKRQENESLNWLTRLLQLEVTHVL
jgi:hypothetical protein